MRNIEYFILLGEEIIYKFYQPTNDVRKLRGIVGRLRKNNPDTWKSVGYMKAKYGGGRKSGVSNRIRVIIRDGINAIKNKKIGKFPENYNINDSIRRVLNKGDLTLNNPIRVIGREPKKHSTEEYLDAIGSQSRSIVISKRNSGRGTPTYDSHTKKVSDKSLIKKPSNKRTKTGNRNILGRLTQ